MSKVLGRNSRVTKSIFRKQPLDAQIEYHKIPVIRRQLQRKLKEHTNKDRTVYGNEHLYDEVFGFWDHVVFTDEAHIDPTAQGLCRVLREQGTRDRLENIEERPPLKGVRFHIVVWISWWGKAEKLRFYNDEEDKVEQPHMPPKPQRRPTTETEEDYQRQLAEWEASKPHARNVKVQGNSITQKYYVEDLLPVYVDAIDRKNA
ncbi:phosphoribosylformylglycinamidine cyclo-ligase protein [Rutstroemia sp. NJR-2017a WRK4]|nr:phosphoribosylformylglycinamidine cyclo-ligase protein [Rutstroemia sp. NJR-2017a WRK4]